MKTTLIALLALAVCMPLGCGKEVNSTMKAELKALRDENQKLRSELATKQSAPKPKPKEPTEKLKPLPKDFKSLRELAEKGDVRAQVTLGFMFAQWERMPANDKEAVKWYRKAAEQGDADGQENLGYAYSTGSGVPADDKEAAKWYRKAAEQGNAAAQYGLGALYALGEGVPEDNVTAYAWMNIAAANASTDAKGFKHDIEQNLTPDQIAKAEALVKEMTTKNPKLLNK